MIKNDRAIRETQRMPKGEWRNGIGIDWLIELVGINWTKIWKKKDLTFPQCFSLLKVPPPIYYCTDIIIGLGAVHISFFYCAALPLVRPSIVHHNQANPLPFTSLSNILYGQC